MITGRLARLRHGDRWLAAGFVVAAAVEAIIRYHAEPVQLTINLPGALTFGCLALRRSRPLLMMSIMAALGLSGSVAQAWMAPDESTNSGVAIFALFVATYSLGAYGTRRDLVLGAPQPVLLILAVDLLQPSNEPLLTAMLFASFFVVVVPIVGGRLVRGRTALVNRLRAQAAELAAHRAEQLDAELARERLRLTEGLHATLLTGMEALADRVAAARNTGDRQPAAAAAIEESARGLLAQTRQIVVALADAPEPLSEPDAAEPTDRPPLPRRDAQPWTALAAAALCAGLIVELRTLPLHAPLPVAVLACALLAVPLAIVWAGPLLMTGVLWLLAALFDGFVASLGSSITAIGLAFVPPFAVAALSSRPRAVAGLAVCCAGDALILEPGASVLISAASWLAGAVLHERSVLAGQLRRNAALLDEQRAAVAQRAVLLERSRVARDVHDAVGHSLTVVALQAGAARRMWTTDRQRAQAVLATIATVTKDGLAELRHGFEPAGPTPSADSVEALVAGARAAGLAVDVSIDDVLGRLDADARLVLYRVVQESLTNVLKHAPGAAARVAVRDAGGHVELAVTNSCGHPAVGVAGSGHGLAGMRARVSACGGELGWDDRPDGGFEVRARLPVAMVRA